MGAYAVNHRYSAARDGRTFGPFEPGTVVELDEADADWVNRDSPGCLTGVAATAETSGEGEPGKDRQHKGGRKRST